jgi:prefoldin subunit 5
MESLEDKKKGLEKFRDMLQSRVDAYNQKIQIIDAKISKVKNG